MKKLFTVLFFVAIVAVSFSCKRECTCTGYHPTTHEADESHSYGKMTTAECQDKQYRMNKDTTFTTVKTWICEN